MAVEQAVDFQKYATSEFFKDHSPRLFWVNEQIEFIENNYLWKPVAIHTKDSFGKWIFQQTKEHRPYCGILNPCDEDGNFVLFPWFRNKDLGELISKRLASASDIDETIDAFVGSLDDRAQFKESNVGLTIPRAELVAIGPYGE